MKKKLLNVILSISLLFTMISITLIDVFADGHPSHNGVGSWNEVTTDLPSTEGNYYLANDIALSGTWNAPTGTTNLCLNGHVINADGGSFSVITIPSGATLNLYDCNSTTSHEGYVDSNSLWHLGTGAGTSKSISGGIITGSSAGGVYVSASGTLNMYGGTIAGNSNGHGGGIYLAQNSQANIINGTIENNNTTAAGAGVHTDGVFKMTGGVIQNNKASGDGGGVSVNGDKGSAILTGTTKIINNKANGQGGGVSYYGASDKVTLGQKVQITDNLGSCNSTPVNNNFYLYYSNMNIILGTGEDAPANGMKVGMSKSSAPTPTTPVQFATNGTANDIKYFVSDNTNYRITFNVDHLEFVDPQVAYNGTSNTGYSTLADAITAAVSGDVIELWEDDNSEDITLPEGVILYTKSNYSGNVTTDISGKIIAKQNVTGDFQWKFIVTSPTEDHPSSNSNHIVLNTGVGNVSTNN